MTIHESGKLKQARPKVKMLTCYVRVHAYYSLITNQLYHLSVNKLLTNSKIDINLGFQYRYNYPYYVKYGFMYYI